MASIKEQVSEHMKTALKGGDKDRLAYARNLFSAIRKKEIDDRKDVADADVLKIIATLVKQRLESIEQFKAGNRQDLVEKETGELAYLKAFMPEQMSETELRAIVTATVKELGLSGPSGMGKAMQAVIAKTQGRADGKAVNQMVREVLGS